VALDFFDYAARAVASFVVPLAHSICYATKGIQPKCSKDITLHLDPLMAEGLCEWSTSLLPHLASFQSLALPLLANQCYWNVDDVSVDRRIGVYDQSILGNKVRGEGQRQVCCGND